ncbi:PREDICTED: stearoyl-CoA desaturase 5-like, partial [Rhagoletis zephyria]|uniref:stearoyl-CoA desaturase 5-like n=1 Tax=Rhagoletis zephyria TaxID=28612 RepID=UPI000811A82D
MTPNSTSTSASEETEVDQPLFDTDYDLERDLKTGERIITEEAAALAVQRIGLAETAYTPIPYKQYFVWHKLIFVSWGMIFYNILVGVFSITVGIQVGAHRLWAHRSFKARFSLRVLLMCFNTMALQTSIFEWSRDHRGHHKWSDSDADPYNANRGFFFSHVGWVALNKHPEVIRKGKTIDMSDLLADPVVMFQKRHYYPLVFVFWFLLPTVIPVYFWGEPIWRTILLVVIFRHVYTLNTTWLVNSWAHMYGWRPYDRRIAPVEASIRHLLMGEGFHNFHHAFPWDYSASELGPLDVFNPATAFIDLFAKMGLAYDLKKANTSLVERKLAALGDRAVTKDGKGSYYKSRVDMLTEWVGVPDPALPKLNFTIELSALKVRSKTLHDQTTALSNDLIQGGYRHLVDGLITQLGILWNLNYDLEHSTGQLSITEWNILSAAMTHREDRVKEELAI